MVVVNNVGLPIWGCGGWGLPGGLWRFRSLRRILSTADPFHALGVLGLPPPRPQAKVAHCTYTSTVHKPKYGDQLWEFNRRTHDVTPSILKQTHHSVSNIKSNITLNIMLIDSN